MTIPIFYKVEVIDPKLLQDVYMGKISLHEAHVLKAKMIKKRNNNLTVLLICAAIFALSAFLGLSYETFQFDDGVMFLLLGGIFIPFFVSIFRFNGLYIALKYLSALRVCQPGSVHTSMNPVFNPNKKDRGILEKISSHHFTAAEARGLRNIAKAERVTGIRFVLLALIMAALISMFFLPPRSFWSFGPQEVWDELYGGSMSFLPKLLAGCLALSVVIRLFKFGSSSAYITAVNRAYSVDREEHIGRLVDELKNRTQTLSVKLTPKRETATVFQSKFGGMPYLPPGFAYPRDSGGRPLRLLAQLNFEELPELQDFPQSGILQFYVADDDVSGVDFNNLTMQKDWSVVYHGSIVRDKSRLGVMSAIEEMEEHYFPVDGEFRLYGEVEQVPITAADFRFDDKLLALYNEFFSARGTKLPRDISYMVYDAFNTAGHRLGGYPFFTQTDPREGEETFKNHTVLLLQIDSDDGIMWGDSGVANFFITPEKLRARDFSDVIYTWDCY